MNGLFISGTDTDVGKTVVAAGVMKALPPSVRSLYWKPIQTGDDDDTETVRRLSDCPASAFLDPTYRFPAPRSPHLAARAVGQEIDLSMIGALPQGRFTVVEGAGGLLVPLNHTTLQIDFIARLGVPVLLVARDKLGAINHTLLSLEACRRRGIKIVGVVLNRGSEDFGNEASLREFGQGISVVTNREATTAELGMLAIADHPAVGALLRELF